MQCWLGVANLLMAERMRKPVNKLKYNKAATAALYATKTADPENVCWQCVMISTMKQFNDLSKRSQFSATDAQCGMLTPPLN